MYEQSKAAKRRYYDGAFHSRYFIGYGIDIGGKPDPLAQYAAIFPGIQEVRTWDLEDGDAQYLHGVSDNTFDFVHASHSLEHMVDARVALANWTRVVTPGGFIIVTVPEEDLYELGHWPSRFNADHRWTFTMAKTKSWSPQSINVVDLAKEFCDRLELERLVLHRDFFREELRTRGIDQTQTPVAECAIEIVWRKRSEPQPTQPTKVAEYNSRATATPIPDSRFYQPLFSPWRGYGEFARLYELAKSHTLVSPDRCWVLYTLAKQAIALGGDLWECGVYRGGTAVILAELLASSRAPAKLHLFDTFAGMPAVDSQRDLHQEGDFADTSLEAVQAAVGHREHVEFHVGRMPETFRGLEKAHVALAHVDVDLYQSVLDCCRFIYPRLQVGGFVVFDDYGFPTCPGARAAVDEFFRGQTAIPLVLPTGQAVVFKGPKGAAGR